MTTTTAAPAATSPELVLRLATGFMASKHLFAAAELGIFETLADGSATLEQISERTGLPRSSVRISLDAVTALGLLERDAEGYRNGPEAAAFLAGAAGSDLRPLLRFWDRLSYRSWTSLATALAHSDSRDAPPSLSEEETRIFSEGVEAITAGPARALAESHDWSGHRRVLDVGGGTGSFLLALFDQHPHLQGTLVELPAVAAIARERLAGRADVVEADALTDPLPSGHDAILVANLIHLLSPASTRQLLARLRAVSAAETTLLLVDFFTDDSHTDPPFAALMAGEFRLVSGDGDVYSDREINDWLTETGWTPSHANALAGPARLITAHPSSDS
jgi:SAM-dependent methyltransferase